MTLKPVPVTILLPRDPVRTPYVLSWHLLIVMSPFPLHLSKLQGGSTPDLGLGPLPFKGKEPAHSLSVLSALASPQNSRSSVGVSTQSLSDPQVQIQVHLISTPLPNQPFHPSQCSCLTQMVLFGSPLPDTLHEKRKQILAGPWSRQNQNPATFLHPLPPARSRHGQVAAFLSLQPWSPSALFYIWGN